MVLQLFEGEARRLCDSDGKFLHAKNCDLITGKNCKRTASTPDRVFETPRFSER